MRTTMIRSLLICTALLLPTAALAADAAREKAAAAFLDATRARSMLENMQTQMDQMFANAVQQMNVSERDKPIVQRYQQQQLQLVKSTFDWSKFESKLTALYASVLTAEDMNAAAAFYRSPAGQHLLAKQAELGQQSVLLMQSTMQELQPKLQALQQQMRAELQPAQGPGTTPGNAGGVPAR